MYCYSTLAQLLAINKTLESLGLLLCGLDDDAICSLANGLQESKQLKQLGLERNDFTTAGVTKLQCVIKDHSTLTKKMIRLPNGLCW